MLPKNLRLEPQSIPTIAKKGKRFTGEFFDIKVWWDDFLKNPEFAISISTRVDKRATVRNRIKRVLREAIKILEKEDFFRKGKYLIIVKSSKIFEFSPDQCVREFKRFFN